MQILYASYTMYIDHELQVDRWIEGILFIWAIYANSKTPRYAFAKVIRRLQRNKIQNAHVGKRTGEVNMSRSIVKIREQMSLVNHAFW